MLPGFRFLFAAIVLSFSILVFGLGAAALLRAAHEAFAANPSGRVPEPKFARQDEAPLPVLAMLRVEPAAAEPKAPDGTPLAEPAAIAAQPDEPERIAALKPQDSVPPEAAPPEMALPETSMRGAAAPTDAPAEQARIPTAALVSPPASEAVAPALEQAVVSCAAADSWSAMTRIATLGGPSVAIEAEPSAKADSSAVKKRIHARRMAQRRRAAQRARLARLAAAQQQAADPFALPTVNLLSR